MRWDQIENEWTAMTRRIRADWKDGPDALRDETALSNAQQRPDAPPTARPNDRASGPTHP